MPIQREQQPQVGRYNLVQCCDIVQTIPSIAFVQRDALVGQWHNIRHSTLTCVSLPSVSTHKARPQDPVDLDAKPDTDGAPISIERRRILKRSVLERARPFGNLRGPCDFLPGWVPTNTLQEGSLDALRVCKGELYDGVLLPLPLAHAPGELAHPRLLSGHVSELSSGGSCSWREGHTPDPGPRICTRPPNHAQGHLR